MGWQPNELYCLPNVEGHGPRNRKVLLFFQCSHMTRVHGQPHSLSQLKKKLTFLWHTNTMSPINKNLFKMMQLNVS